MWAFKQLWDKGLIYQAYRVHALQLGRRDAAVELRDPPRRRHPAPPGPGASPWRFDLDPERRATPAPLQILAWTTTPWTLPSNLALAVGPDLDYAVVDHDGAYYVLGAATLGRYAAELGEATTVATAQGRRPRRPHLRAAVRLLRRQPRRSFRVLAGDFVDTAEGTGVVHLAPGFGEDDQRVCEAERASRSWSPSTRRASSPPRSPTGPASTCSRPTPTSSATSRRRAGCCATRPTTTTTRTAGAPTRRSSTGPCSPGTSRSPTSPTACSSTTRRSTGSPTTCRTARSASGWPAPATGRSAATASGARPIPVWESDDPEYPRTDVYGSLDEIEARLRRPAHRPAPAVHRRPHPAQPRRPHRAVSTMRRVPEVLDCWFESGSMPYAQVHYPFENKEWFDSHAPGRLHRRVHRPDPRLVLHAARPVGGAVRPARVPQRASATAWCSTPTAASSPRSCATTPTPKRSWRQIGSDAPALVPDGVADPARRRPQDRRPTAPASPTWFAWCSTRSGTPSTSSRSTPTPTATRPSSAPTPPASSTATSWPRPARSSRPSPRPWTPTTSPAPATRSRPTSTR